MNPPELDPPTRTRPHPTKRSTPSTTSRCRTGAACCGRWPSEAAGAAAAGAAVALGNPGTVAADDGDPLAVGATNSHALGDERQLPGRHQGGQLQHPVR